VGGIARTRPPPSPGINATATPHLAEAIAQFVVRPVIPASAQLLARRGRRRSKLLMGLAPRAGRFPQLGGLRSGLMLDMRQACTHAYHMSKMVQIRNVPDALHRKLKVRAADSGQTLSDYLLAELERLTARPTRDEMLTRIHSRKRVTLKTPAAVVIREERESA